MKLVYFQLFFFMVFLATCGGAKAPTLGENAPAFHVKTAQGEATFPDDFLGGWTLLMSVPNIMTPVCSMELAKCVQMAEQWKDLHIRTLVLTCHESAQQQFWLESVLQKEKKNASEENLPFLVPDPEKKIAHLYGMIHPFVTNEKPIRALFVIDPVGKIRFVAFYPMKNGRNFEEITRIIAAMQQTDAHGGAVTLPDWKLGDETSICVPCTQLHK